MVRLGIVRDDHAVGDDHARGILVGREEPHRETGVHRQGLLVGHGGEVLHGQPVLGPVLEDGAVAAVGDQFVRMLGDPRVQVVLDHRHDGGGLPGAGGIFVDRAGVHRVIRAETVHVDAAVVLEFPGEFRSEHGVMLGGEVAQGVLQREDFFFFGEDILAFRGMVDARVPRFRLGQDVGNAGEDIGLKFIHGLCAG